MTASTFEGLPVKSVSIENMLNQREAVIERVRRAVADLREAARLAGAAGLGFPRFRIDECRYDMGLIDQEDGAVEGVVRKIVDRGAWQHLMSESGLRSLMDATARAAWDRGIEKGEFPDLTAATVAATFQQLHGARGDMFDRGVIAVFKGLSWDYSTNRPFKFGKRIVMRFVRAEVKPRDGSTGLSLGYVNHDKANQLDDLNRVFAVLDGKPEPDHRGGWFHLLSQARTLRDPEPENEYMRVRCFRNGNGHIQFLRLDLVEKMNAILARHFPGALDYHPLFK